MMQKRVVLGESRLRARKRRQRLLIFGGSAILFLFVLGVLVWLSWASFIRITVVAVTGTHITDPKAVEVHIQKELSQNYFYIFSKRNIFLYPKQKIKENILSQFTAVKRVDVRAGSPAGGFHTLAVDIVERTPAALWCGEVEASTSNCLLLDDTGLAYSVSAEYSGNVYRKYYGAIATTSLPKQFLGGEQFRSLSALVDALAKETAPLGVRSVSVDAAGDTHVQFENNFVLLFALGSDGGDVLQRFVAALGADPFVGSSLSNFEYLDLRFGDKLYYKQKTP